VTEELTGDAGPIAEEVAENVAENAEEEVRPAALDVDTEAVDVGPADVETVPAASAPQTLDAQELLISAESVDSERSRLKAIIEGVIYITDEPLSTQQIAAALSRPIEQIQAILDDLTADYAKPDRGLSIREVAGGFKMATKPEHHEDIRAFVKNLKPPLKLSLAALETLAVIAYKQPITAPEIMEIRGVQGAGVLKTLLDRKLIATAGRKNVIGKPILYRTTREFLLQFGLKDLAELPTLKEFEELGRLALTDAEADPGEAPVQEPGPEPPPIEEPPPPPEEPEPPQKVETAAESNG
jgi:segregation and condensation protein B